MKKYFSNIWNAIKTIFDGMSITFSYLLQKPITVQYPDRTEKPVKEMLPEGYRGLLGVDIDRCIACKNCMRACPIDCIDLEGARTELKKGLTLLYFNIHLGKCMYCGLCVEACPTKPPSIYFTKEFEGAEYDIDKLVYVYVPPEEAERRIKLAKEYKKKLAEKKQQQTKQVKGS